MIDDPRPGSTWTHLSDAARARSDALKARGGGWIERHRDRVLVDVALRLYQRDGEAAGPVVSSAIAFRLFLFFVPLLLFGVGLVAMLSTWFRPSDVTDVVGVSGTLRDQIKAALSQPNHTRWIAVFIGLVGMGTTGRTLSKTMSTASSLAWQLPARSKTPTRVTGAMVGIVGTIGLLAAVINRLRSEYGIAVAAPSYLVAFVVYVVGWLLLFARLPKRTSDPGALLPGVAVVAGTTTLMQLVSQLYLPDRIARASALYGAIGTSIVTLGWFFFVARAITLAMTLNAVLDERLGSVSRLVFALPLLRVLPRRSARVRRYFGLDGEDDAAR